MKSERLSQPFLTNAPDWWEPKRGELFDAYQDYHKIASCSFCVVDVQTLPCEQKQYFPASWFIYKNISKTKPVLEIIGLETLNNKGKGYGRLILQSLYQKSMMCGCSGRMQVMASFGAGSFYEHCGFSGGQKGKDGLKFFEPTEKNVAALFSRGMEAHPIKFIPAPLAPKDQNNTLLCRAKKSFQR